MKVIFKRISIFTSLFLALIFMAPAHAIDLLELPAVKSGAASRTLLLDITTKGEGSYVAVGTFGVIIISEDDGETWEQAQVPASVTLTSVFFPTPELGWAVGHDGLILHSSDGGRNWVKQLDGHELNDQIMEVAERIVTNSREELEALQADETADEYDIEDAEFMLEEAEFALEGAMDDTDAGPVRPLLDVWFRNEREGMVAGSYGMLLLTQDGGKTWRLESDRMRKLSTSIVSRPHPTAPCSLPVNPVLYTAPGMAVKPGIACNPVTRALTTGWSLLGLLMVRMNWLYMGSRATSIAPLTRVKAGTQSMQGPVPRSLPERSSPIPVLCWPVPVAPSSSARLALTLLKQPTIRTGASFPAWSNAGRAT